MLKSLKRRPHYAGWQLTEDRVRDRSADARLQLKTMAVKPGMKVADIGAGAGYFAVKIAGLVGKKGFVHATDSRVRWVEHLRRYARNNHIDNIRVKRARSDYATGMDSFGDLDLIIMINSLRFESKGDMGVASRYAREILRMLGTGGRLIYYQDRLISGSCGKKETIELLLDAGFSGRYQDLAIPSGGSATSEYPVPGFFLVFRKEPAA